jgi:hypothetical protein
MVSKLSSVLNARLSHIIEGKTFHEWSEDLIDENTPLDLPVDLSEYFSKRRIKHIQLDNSLSFPAQLIKNDDGFIIKVKKQVDYGTNASHRFLIAHEIAHTFQYTFNSEKIEERSFFLPGSFEAEYFGNRLARNILLPKKLLLAKLKSLTGDIKKDFSFQLLSNMAEIFIANQSVILTRIINDLDILSSVAIFRFIKTRYSDRWMLYGKHVSNIYENKKYYIPKGNKHNLQKQYVSAGNSLSRYLDELQEKLSFSYMSTDIYIEMLNDKPLLTFFKNFTNKTSVPGIIGKVEVYSGTMINFYLRMQ